MESINTAITEAGRKEVFARHITGDMGVTVDENMGGLALIVLGILALGKIDPSFLNSIATIVAGMALMIVSVELGTELGKALHQLTGQTLNPSESARGVNAGVLGGIAGVILGILAIIGVARPELVSVALIVFGAAVLFDFIASAQLRALKMMTPETSEPSSQLAVAVATSTHTATTIVGVALITLGFLALSGVGGDIPVSVALLSLGGYLFLEGSAMVGRMMFWKA
jgi:hypothetical protein